MQHDRNTNTHREYDSSLDFVQVSKNGSQLHPLKAIYFYQINLNYLGVGHIIYCRGTDKVCKYAIKIVKIAIKIKCMSTESNSVGWYAIPCDVSAKVSLSVW